MKAIKDDLMANTGKKPIERKLEEARAKIFNNDTFKELLKPEFLNKAFESTFICVLISMVLHYFIKQELCKESIKAFINTLIQNTTERIEQLQEGIDTSELNRVLLLSHPFTQRMVGLGNGGEKVHSGLLSRLKRLES